MDTLIQPDSCPALACGASFAQWQLRVAALGEGVKKMFVRSSTIMAEPAQIDDGIIYVREEVRPQVAELPGNLGLSMWVDRPSGRAVVTTFWTDRKSLEASSAVAASLRQESAKRLAGESTVEVTELVHVHRVKPSQPGYWSRFVELDVAADDIDRLVRHFESSSLPSLQQHDGLVVAIMGVNRDDGKALVATTFETRQALDASRSGSEERRDKSTSEVPSASVTSVLELELVIAGWRD